MVRLFIYHVEVQNEQEEIRALFNKQYTLMEKRLANIITTPGMLLAVIMASGLLYMQPVYLTQIWMQFKLLFVVFLLIYHFYCYKIMNELTNNQYNYSGQQLRALNELPTLLLVVVVMLVVYCFQAFVFLLHLVLILRTVSYTHLTLPTSDLV